MSSTLDYLRAACRTLSRRRSAYLGAIAILALGIGAGVAMFSLVDAVLLRPLPFPRQDAIEVIWKKDPPAGLHVEELAYPELRDLQQNIAAFDSVALLPTSLYGYARVLRTGASDPVSIESAPVSHDFFRVLGVSPFLGRDFRAADEQVDAPPTVILSQRVWRQQLAADPHIVGRLISLNGRGVTVIGVMPPAVEFPRGAGLWVPLGVDRRVVENRRATFLQAIARIRPGFRADAVAAQVNTLFVRLAADHPDAYSPTQQAVVTSLPEYWTGSARLHLWILLAASCLLFVAALISAGNLFLSRAIARRREIATRIAIGARRGQLVAQFAAEGAVAGILAALGGIVIAYAAVDFLRGFVPADIPRLETAALHPASLVCAAGAAILAAIACSALPAWFATRALPPAATRAQGGFVFAQAAVTVVLLVMAALLVRSYQSMLRADTGFANRDTVTLNVALRGPGLFAAQGYDAESRRAFYTRLLERLRQSSGVTSAAALLLRPLEGAIGWDVPYQFEFDASSASRDLPKVNFEVVTPEYFRTVGTALLEGRDFDSRDTSTAEGVIIVSQPLAQQIRRAGHEPIGHRVRLGVSSPWLKIVGVVAAARYRNITQEGADLFVPYLQAAPPTNYVVIRGTRSTAELAALVRRELRSLDPGQAVAGTATIGDLIDRNMLRHRFNLVLLFLFGVCASILAATAVYSVIAESVAARSRELAIKTALGAGRGRLIGDLVRRTLLFVLAGQAAGVIGAIILARAASDLLYGVSPESPGVLVTVSAFLAGISLISALVPAWRSGDFDPSFYRG